MRRSTGLKVHTERNDNTTNNRVNPIETRSRIENNVTRLRYLKKYPWASNWSLDAIIQFERNAVPVSVNGVIRTPTTYKPKTTTVSTAKKRSPNRKAAKQLLAKLKELEEVLQAAEVINHPYNPIGWIPGVRSLFNAGADLIYSSLTGLSFTPYTIGAGISTGLDVLPLRFGLGPLNNYVGAYAGTVGGGLIGELFDHPILGSFVGGMLGGGFRPSYTRLYRANPRNPVFKVNNAENGEAQRQYAGMWFTNDPRKGAYYAANYVRGKDPFEGVDLQYVDIPTYLLKRYKASNVLPKRFEHEPEDYIIPFNISRTTIPFNPSSKPGRLEYIQEWENFVNNYTRSHKTQLEEFLTPNFLLDIGLSAATKPAAYEITSLPGFLIKSLFRGSPLEKQLSKQGTISIKQLLAYIGRNDVPSIDKELIGRALQNHANDTHIDYNTLRKEVQGMIPLYNRVSLSKYADYGVDKLGFSRTEDPRYASAPINEVPFDGLKLNTFTFESPNIIGNHEHYDINTLGHTRTYTTNAEPNILHILETQSDWALSLEWKNGIKFTRTSSYLNNPEEYRKFIDGHKRLLEEMKFNPDLYQSEDIAKQELNILFHERILADMIAKQNGLIDLVLKHMGETYLTRQLQENLKYAALNKQTKMRYPTPETAAKIEYYEGMPTAEYELVLDDLDHLNTPMLLDDPYNVLEVKLLQKKKAELELSGKAFKYRPEHQTILNKYANFPNLYHKLFGKNTEVRTVKDDKGNTWYEVDVPLSYLDGTAEMLFKKGGKLKWQR